MAATAIVFFYAIITVGNESVFPKAEKYLPTIFYNLNAQQLKDIDISVPSRLAIL